MKTIDKYMHGLTTLMDQLAILGKPLDHEDQVKHILDTLPAEYKHVDDQIEGKDTPPLLAKVHERLLNHEAKLLLLAAATPSSFPMTSIIAQQRNPNPKNRNQNQCPHYNNNNNNLQPQQNNKSENRFSRKYFSKCQLRGTQGHNAKYCPHLQSMHSFLSSTMSSPFTPWQPRANLAVDSPYTTNK